MNITEFAEQIVFGTTLEEKLATPGRLTYDSVGSPRVNEKCFVAPSRPQGMLMQPAGAIDVPPPRDDQLENERTRGALLHRLANHELLATELMALVLLKFPDAPIAFRRGVLVTLQEEQEHTRMYLRRMQDCGVEFGEHPLSGQFWRIVAPMETPMDFVSRLSLTFEQANLDYSRHFANVFQRIGDVDTAKVLQQVYLDEISHVQHGLEWFRQWKDPAQSDWEAYQQSLEHPMSPQRARGPNIQFNRDGRIQAGLSEDFVDEVETFRQSRGRASTLRWFDPGAEAKLLADVSAKEQRLLDQLGRDLELLMLFTAKADDVLLVRERPSRELSKRFIAAGVPLPEMQRFEDWEVLADRGLHDASPWAWTPANHAVVAPLNHRLRQPASPWVPGQADLFRKSWSTARLWDWLGDEANDAASDPPVGGSDGHWNNVAPEFFCGRDVVGSVVGDLGQVAAALTQLAADGWDTALVKQDLAASGRGQRRFDIGTPLTEQDQHWLASIFAAGGAVIEPQLERVVDLSFLWQAKRDGSVDFLGWTRPLVTPGRRYAGTQLGDKFADNEPDVKRFLLSDRCDRLRQTSAWLEERLVPELNARSFVGYFGVDAFLYRASRGLAIKPLVELNPRMTMGHIAQRIEKRLAPGVSGQLQVLTRGQWQQQSAALEKIPFEKTGSGHWKSAAIVCCEVTENTKLVPVVTVGRTS